jgi:hypothetical protein
MACTNAKQAANNPIRNAIFSVLLLAISLVLCLLAAEAFLRLKNSAMTN